MARIDGLTLPTRQSPFFRSYGLSRANWVTLLAAVTALILWASAFAGIRAGLTAYSPAHVALLRYLTASSVLAIYALLTRMPLPQRRDLPVLLGLGFVGLTVYNVALNTGEVGISAGVASMIVAIAPLLVAVWASLFLDDRLTKWGWLAMVISFTGVAIIAVGGTGEWRISPRAVLILVAAVAQSIFVVSQKPLFKRYSPIQLTSYVIWAGTFFLSVFGAGLLGQIKVAAPDATLAVIYMGVFPGAIGYICWAMVLSRLPASKAGNLLYLIPLLASLIAWVWLGETPTLLATLGGVLVLGGVILMGKRGKASLKS